MEALLMVVVVRFGQRSAVALAETGSRVGGVCLAGRAQMNLLSLR